MPGITMLVEYKEGDTVLEGFLAIPQFTDEKLAAVLIYPTYEGRVEFVENKARDLASLGYVALAVDVYGKGIKGHSREESLDLMRPYKTKENRSTLLKRRLLAALDYVKNLPYVDVAKIFAIGYCFGGLAVLDLARYNVGLAGVVSFHGTLKPIPDAESPEILPPIHTKILVCHGDADTHIPIQDVLNFMEEMRQRKADWQFITYSDAKHGFTEPHLINSTYDGIGYDERAAKRSWNAMLNFFEDILSS